MGRRAHRKWARLLREGWSDTAGFDDYRRVMLSQSPFDRLASVTFCRFTRSLPFPIIERQAIVTAS